MFSRRLTIERIDAAEAAHQCPIVQIDNFAMRNFTNDAVFDDTLPIADGLMEVGLRVPLDRLRRRHGGLVPAQELSGSRRTPAHHRGCRAASANSALKLDLNRAGQLRRVGR